MEDLILIGVSLSDVKVIMAIMCVLMVELLCQAVTRWILVLECLFPGLHVCLQLCLVLSSFKQPPSCGSQL
jgi:hypothetical protein